MGGNRAIGIVVGVASLVLVLDQVIKVVIVAAIGPSQAASSIGLIGTWLSLEYVENRGAAFGLFSGAGPILLLAAAAMLLVLAWSVLKSPQQPVFNIVAFGLILGGALGNLVDRFRLGYVVDFISVGWWPTFNLADSAICVGVAIMLMGWLFHDQHGLTPQARH